MEKMTAKEIRKTFWDFFAQKKHTIVPSAPIVVKDDPTLMFTNAGMNPFKDFFLGNKVAEDKRVANSQKCLRVSGKHNDLEEVGVDTYHHTMFEMLGNWSFGDYFKKEAIAWAWELLTEVYGISKDRLYVTVFEGDKANNLARDTEAYNLWKQFIAEDRIIDGNKEDNFWEMGDTGPCGPCSEIHADIRSDEDRAAVDGRTLVNQDHPEVVEIWNLVFMQFNRKADGSLHSLPDTHVDTGMGFERLCMVLQGVQSNYDTDVFTPLIAKVSSITGVPYGKNEKTSIAIRVISDHIRAVSFAINDGQLPSNTGAGYVIRRILRRAVRYAYSHLEYQKPILHQLLPTLIGQFEEQFPNLVKNKGFIEKVILQEEESFLRTLASGLRRLHQVTEDLKTNGQTQINGETAFKLFDTYGFPFDLTQLIASESGLSVDEAGFDAAMTAQRERARAATKMEAGDWIPVSDSLDSIFMGYDQLTTTSQVVKYREVSQKNKKSYQIILDITPFYAESGGQVGDVGYLAFGEEKISIINTVKENNLIIHLAKKLPKNIEQVCKAVVSATKRQLTSNNHTSTHLLHAALREVLGEHVEQRGSLVNPDYLRFDFSHFAKVSEEQMAQIEARVNEKIRANIPLQELRDTPIDEAKAMGAMALFGEKYGDSVRVIVFDRNYSVELCGGTHVQATGEIGLCRVVSESAVAAGIRRIEAYSGPAAYDFVAKELTNLKAIKGLFKNPKKLVQTVESAVNENAQLKKQIERMQMEKAGQVKNGLKSTAIAVNGVQFIGQVVDVETADMVKKIAFDLRNEVDNLFLVLGAKIGGKAHLTVMINQDLQTSKGLNASKIIRGLAKNIRGGGGGQAYYATAGGKNPDGLPQAIADAKAFVESL